MKRFSSILIFLFLLSCGGSTPPPQTAAKTTPPTSLQKAWEDPEQLFKEAQANYQAGNYSVAQTALDRILSVYPKSTVAPEARKMSDEIQGRLGESRVKIGVVLPLSGQYARFGEAALDGISCAIGLFDPCGSPTAKAQIVVRDSKGSPSVAAEAVKQLVDDDKVGAIIGPLLSVEAPGAAAAGQSTQIPMLILAPQEGVTIAGDFIFQHALRPQNEVAAVVRQASQAGLRRFIILYPNNAYGKEYQILFSNEVMQTGTGKIIALKSYSPDLPDFNGLIEELKTKLGAEKVGIFIPDSYKQVTQIAQALDAAGVVGPKLLGTSRWYHPQLLEETAPALEGSLFAVGFYPEANRESTHTFSDSFYKAYGNPPAALEAFAYDGTRLLLNALGNGKNAASITRAALLGIQDFPAVVGPLSWSEQRVSKWPIDVLTIREGKFAQAHP